MNRIPTLGPRGEGWVLIQATLFAGVIVAGLVRPRWPRDLQVPVLAIALISGAGGLWLIARAIGTLGTSVSPFPKPPAASELKESGVYALVRHPIYGGILLLSLAWSLALSPWALIPTGALAIALELKSRLEERWLLNRHPRYAGYPRARASPLRPLFLVRRMGACQRWPDGMGVKITQRRGGRDGRSWWADRCFHHGECSCRRLPARRGLLISLNT